MIPAIVVCHGLMGASLCGAAQSITGLTGRMIPVSNEGLDKDGLTAEISARLDELGGRAILFADFPVGSCATSCLAVRSGNPRTVLITGVSLPMLIYYLNHRADDGLADLTEFVEKIIHRGQNAIRELMPPEL